MLWRSTTRITTITTITTIMQWRLTTSNLTMPEGEGDRRALAGNQGDPRYANETPLLYAFQKRLWTDSTHSRACISTYSLPPPNLTTNTTTTTWAGDYHPPTKNRPPSARRCRCRAGTDVVQASGAGANVHPHSLNRLRPHPQSLPPDGTRHDTLGGHHKLAFGVFTGSVPKHKTT